MSLLPTTAEHVHAEAEPELPSRTALYTQVIFTLLFFYAIITAALILITWNVNTLNSTLASYVLVYMGCQLAVSTLIFSYGIYIHLNPGGWIHDSLTLRLAVHATFIVLTMVSIVLLFYYELKSSASDIPAATQLIVLTTLTLLLSFLDRLYVSTMETAKKLNRRIKASASITQATTVEPLEDRHCINEAPDTYPMQRLGTRSQEANIQSKLKDWMSTVVPQTHLARGNSGSGEGDPEKALLLGDQDDHSEPL